MSNHQLVSDLLGQCIYYHYNMQVFWISIVTVILILIWILQVTRLAILIYLTHLEPKNNSTRTSQTTMGNLLHLTSLVAHCFEHVPMLHDIYLFYRYLRDKSDTGKSDDANADKPDDTRLNTGKPDDDKSDDKSGDDKINLVMTNLAMTNLAIQD